MIVCRTALAALLTGLIAFVTPALGQTPVQGAPTAPTDPQVRELEQQIKSLQQQLDEIKAAPNAAARQKLMQQNWQGMQAYMGQMHDRWGTGYPWMMGHPWRSTGPGMMGGVRTSWPLPQGLTPDQYSQQMRDQMQRMQEQMNKIAQTSDPQERQRLMQEHWQSTYQNMQTMRGMGWMWGGGGMMGPGMIRGGMMQGGPAPSAKALPDADSTGAKLVSTYCAQCHAAPEPTLHTAKQWARNGAHAHPHAGQLAGHQDTERAGNEDDRCLHAEARAALMFRARDAGDHCDTCSCRRVVCAQFTLRLYRCSAEPASRSTSACNLSSIA